MAKIISFSIVILVGFMVCCPVAVLHEADAAETQGQSAAGTIVSSFSVAFQTVEPQGIEFLNNYLYISRGEDPYRKIYQYDTQGNLVQVISTSNGCPRELAWDGAYFWHPDTCFHRILKIDGLGNTIQSFASPYASPCAIAWDGTDLWLSFAGQGNKIFRMDTSGNLTGDSITTPTADYPSGLVFVGGYFWVSGYTDEKIYQVDMAGNILSLFDAPGTQPAGLAFDGKYLWHTDIGTDRVYQIEIYTGPPFIVTDRDTVMVPEGSTATFKVKISEPPSSFLNVSVQVIGGDTDIAVQSGSNLTFTPSNWNTYRTVTLVAADGDDPKGRATIRISAEGISDKEIMAIEADNDLTCIPGVVTTLPIASGILPYVGQGFEHDGNHLWLPTVHPDSKVYKIDPFTGSIVDSYGQDHYQPGISNVHALAFDRSRGYLYNYVYPYGPFYLVDTLTLQQIPNSSFAAPANWIHDIALDPLNQVLWVMTGDSIGSNYRIYKLNSSNGSVEGSFTSPANAANPIGLAWDGTNLWVSESSSQSLYRVNPGQALIDGNCDNSVLSLYRLPEMNLPVARLAWDGRYLWTMSTTQGLFYKIDPCSPLTGSLQVTISPEGAIDAGARWRIDGGVWQVSGYTQSVPVGEHTLEFSDLSGWVKPGNQVMTISGGQMINLSGTYTPQETGSLQVTISPQEAIDAGAKWRVDEGAWHDSGYIQQLPVGQHTVDFNNARGCMKPNNRTVTISNGQTTHVTGTYLDCTPGALMVNIYPQAAIDAGARWRRVGTSTWLDSGVLETMIPLGQHTVEFSDVPGWVKPTNQWVTATFGQTATASGTYVLCSASFIVVISPQEVINAGAKWRRVGTGTWLDSGYTETGIPCGGERTVEFNDIPGWMKPPNQSVTISDGQTATVVGNFDAKPVSFPFFDDFSTDQGWSGYELGGWERGPVLKGHAERGYSDPALDHSLNEDNFVLGFAIGGNYPNGISETKWIISPPIDCTGQEQVFLKFWRYLDVQGNKVDHAAIYVSKDGTEFYRVWENPRSFVCDSHWVRKVYDISAIAANQATVYIAFGMGPTNSSGQFSGWNIDDVEVTSWYSISGFVRDRAGTPIPDVEVCFTDEFAYQIRPCVVSDEYGYYVQYGFEPYSLTKSYVYIVPSGHEFYFSPFKKKVKVINADIKVNFRAFSPIRQLGGE